MAPIPIVIDTNVWIDLSMFISRLEKNTGKTYQQIWETFDDDFIRENLTKEQQETNKATINTIKRICEMKESKTNKYEIHIPSYVYNEAARKISSKISSSSTGNDKYVDFFDKFFDSLPIDKIIDKKLLEPEIDYPKKSTTNTEKEREEIMKNFLENKKELTEDLIEHIRNTNKEKKSEVQERIKKLQDRITDVKYKFEKWDKLMTESSKSLDFSYSSRSKTLNSLFDPIKNKYKKVGDIKFEPDPFDAVAKRLTTVGEEFDLFDLQIYLYAKKVNAPIITQNTQAFQEINDPYFLGYFDDMKIMHPSVNFDSLEDLNSSGDLNEIIDRSIKKDFEADLAICNKLDERLENKVLGSKGKIIIDEAESKYSPSEKRLEIKRPLGAVLSLLRIENKKLKISKETFFRYFKQLDTLKFIEEQLFNNQLKSEDFIKTNVPIDEARKKVLKSNTLASHLKKNAGLKKTIEKYEKKSGTYFDEFLKIYKDKTKGAEVSGLFIASEIEDVFSESEIKEALNDEPPQKSLPAKGCPAKLGSRKREATKCFLEWEDIEKFNDGKIQERDPSKVKIDSEKFIEYLKTVKDPNVRKQLIEFTDQVLNSAEDHLSKISGPKLSEVAHLINKQKVLDHFTKVHTFASSVNYGLFAKNLLGDILTGDIKGVALNIGFLAGSYGLSELAAISFAKGSTLAIEGQLVLGRSMKLASPFIGRFMSVVILIDLFNQIDDLKAGNPDAIVGVVGDGVLLIVDAVDIGVSLLEIAGLVEGVSAVTGPIGVAIGAVVIVGTEIYSAVRKVEKIDKLIHLTAGERWKLGAGTFFSLGIWKSDLEGLAIVKDANNNLAQQALESLKNNKEIQRIVIPSAVLRGKSRIELEQDNKFVPSNLASNIRWHRVRPDDPVGGWIFCAPQGNWENPPRNVMGRCENSIGVSDLAIKKQNNTLFNLGDGNDEVQGFKDSPNIFRIGKGYKKIRGGDKNDVIILDDFPQGEIIGGGGSNLLDLRGVGNKIPNGLVINFQEEPMAAYLTHINTPLSKVVPDTIYYDIDSIIGRENMADFIYTNCSTKYVDNRGGGRYFLDYIYIKHTYKECNHDKVIKLGHNTFLKNEAVTGKFSYFINDIYSDITCVLKRSPPYKTQVIKNNQIQHKFFINGKLSDISKLDFDHDEYDDYDVTIRMYFEDKTKKGKLNLETVLGHGKDKGGMDNIAIHLKDDVEIRYNSNGIHALHKSDKPVLEIIKKYQPIAIKLGISFYIYANTEGAVVSIGSDEKDDVLYNDPSTKTYLVGNKGNDTYIIISGQDFLPGPDPPQIPEIDIYSTGSQNHLNTLDLHDLSQQIKEDLGQELLMKHVFDSEKLVLYLYTINNQTYGTDSYNNVTSITFRNIPSSTTFLVVKESWDSWCSRLHVLLNRAPVVLKCDRQYQNNFGRGLKVIDNNRDVIGYNPSNYYTPLPLVFSDYEIIMLSENDIEPHTEVIVKQKLGQYKFLRLENDLILTNGFDSKVPTYRPTTVIIKNFYKNPAVFNTLKFTFNDKVMSFKEEVYKIQRAIALEDAYEEYERISNSIISDLPRRSKRDLGISKKPSNRKKFAKFEQPQLPATGLFGSWFQSLSNICYKSLGYVHNYYKSLVSSTPMLVGNQFQNTKDNFPNEHRIVNERISSSKTNMPLPNENQITHRDINSTLLLLDVLVRRLNDSKYKLPSEDHLLPPQEQVQKKIVELTKKLGLDDNDIEGSMEEQHRRLLYRLSEK